MINYSLPKPLVYIEFQWQLKFNLILFMEKKLILIFKNLTRLCYMLSNTLLNFLNYDFEIGKREDDLKKTFL
jgi:protein associated with RNAse G/E